MDPIKEQLIKVIYNGEDFEDSSHLKLLYESFHKNSAQDNIDIDQIHKDNDEQTSCGQGLEQLDRILEMKRYFKWVSIPSGFHTRFQKCPIISTYLRELAFKQQFSTEQDETKSQQKALRGYNLAIAFAPPDSAEITLALEKRASLLLQLGYPELAQFDIHAVASNPAYPLKSMKSAQKLIDLQTRCSALVHSRSKKAQTIRRNVEARFVENNFYHIRSRNSRVENVSECCNIDYDPYCGRRIVVTRNVEPGEVLLVDEPYSIILERILNWDLEHCSNCSRPVISGVACDCCTFAWFCSTSCKIESTRGPHKYEKYLSYLKSSKIMSLKGILAARLLFKVGPEELYKIFTTKNESYFQPSNASGEEKGFSPNGVYTAKSYLPIFHLISHMNVDILKAKSNAFKALILTNLIDDTSQFFSRVKYNEDFLEFKDFIASLLLRHMEAIEYNAITLSQLVNNPSSNNNLQSSTLRYGGGVYPVLCLVNHSCDPNSVPVRSLKYLKTSVIAMKPLQPGDEVTFSYAPHFAHMETHERRKFLLDRYNFKCQCEACLSWWEPDTKTILVPESQCNACGRFLLSGQCPRCIQKDIDVRRVLPIFEGQVAKIEKLLQTGEYLLAFETIKPCLKFCYENLPHNFTLGLEFQELFKLILVKLVSLG
ncbi:SET and MYND domain-containing protein 4 [Folsomia candida]|uniref:SET and MYND domain-containing protein 4 n=1 Tax=Folsomia candida TaxID=158441 RepID=UPI000B8F8D01|nr:SET and MYND domain-containing protein 4 [Folsomia candida]